MQTVLSPFLAQSINASEVITGELDFSVLLEHVEMCIFSKVSDPPHCAFPSPLPF